MTMWTKVVEVIPRRRISQQSQSASRDIRVWIGIVLIALSLIAANAMTHALGRRTPAFAMSHAVAAGSVVTDDDIREVSVAVPVEANLIGQRSEVVGMRVTRAMAVGEFLTEQALTNQVPSQERIVALPIKAGHLPSLNHGSEVEVWMTPSLQGVAIPGPAQLIVERALVVAAPAQIDSMTDSSITISIPATSVEALQTAMRDGNVDVVAIPSESVK